MKQYEPTRAVTNTMLLFGTPLFLYDEYCNITEVHDTTAEQGHMIINRGGNYSSTETNILDLDSYSEIKKRILSGLHEYVNDVLHIDSRHEFYITQSWLNVNPPGSTHHKHNHSNSIISGVYYIDTSEDDSIVFSSHHHTTVTNNPSLQFDVTAYTPANSSSWSVPTKTNSILYFPSVLLHEVNPNTSNKNRISLAFNCFVKGSFGKTNTLNELKL